MIDNEPSDLQILELASRRYRRRGARDQAAAAELGLSSTQYARRLLAIVEAPSLEVMATYGGLVARLRRVLDMERARRRPSARAS